jgi:hypothetical protein
MVARVTAPVRRWVCAAWAVVAAVLLAGALPARAEDMMAAEYEVKAAFLYNFAKFIEWPTSSGGPAPADVVLCVVGPDPFGPTLTALADRDDDGRHLKVRHLVDLGGDPGCHIAFISAVERPRLGSILARATAQHVVTVADLDGFARAGGVIQFVLEDGRVRFWINRGAAARSGVQLSSRLLALAHIVEGPPQ